MIKNKQETFQLTGTLAALGSETPSQLSGRIYVPSDFYRNEKAPYNSLLLRLTHSLAQSTSQKNYTEGIYEKRSLIKNAVFAAQGENILNLEPLVFGQLDDASEDYSPFHTILAPGGITQHFMIVAREYAASLDALGIRFPKKFAAVAGVDVSKLKSGDFANIDLPVPSEDTTERPVIITVSRQKQGLIDKAKSKFVK